MGEIRVDDTNEGGAGSGKVGGFCFCVRKAHETGDCERGTYLHRREAEVVKVNGKTSRSELDKFLGGGCNLVHVCLCLCERVPAAAM